MDLLDNLWNNFSLDCPGLAHTRVENSIGTSIEAGNFFILISLPLLEIRLKYEIVFIRTTDKRSCAYGLLRYRNARAIDFTQTLTKILFAIVEGVRYRSRDKIRNQIVERRVYITIRIKLFEFVIGPSWKVVWFLSYPRICRIHVLHVYSKSCTNLTGYTY